MKQTINHISLSFHFKSSKTAKGTIAEIAVTRALKNEGLKAFHLRLAGHDVETINPATGSKVRIEVKLATQGQDGKYRATTIKRGCTDHRKSDFIVLLCQLPNSGGLCVPFIIPCSFQGDKSHIAITSNPLTYNGVYSQFRSNWTGLIGA